MVRNMTIADYDEVYALWMQIKGFAMRSVDDSREGVERFLNRNPKTSVVGIEDGKVVGAILCGHDGRRGFIYHTAVHPDCRKQGIGTKLTEAALQALKECGISKVALVVFSRNAEGNRFWEKMGITAREDLTYRNRALKELVRLDT